jgi:hypothetical protein
MTKNLANKITSKPNEPRHDKNSDTHEHDYLENQQSISVIKKYRSFHLTYSKQIIYK